MDICIYGEIVVERPVDEITGQLLFDGYVTLEDLAYQFEEAKFEDEITIRVNSPGGDMDTAVAILSRISELPANKTVIIEGLAASAASYITSKIDGTVKIFEGSQMMIHEPVVEPFGSISVNDSKNIADGMEDTAAKLADAYANKSGKSVVEIRELMAEETWFNSEEAVAFGLADELVTVQTAEIEITKEQDFLISGGVKMSALAFKNIPKGLPLYRPTARVRHKAKKTRQRYSERNLGMISKLRKRRKNKFRNSRRSALSANNSERAAIRAERSRIKSIEKIEDGITDKKFLYNAKFGANPLTADEVALHQLTQDKRIGGDFLSNRQKEYSDSNLSKIKAKTPGGISEEQKTALAIAKNFRK